MGQYAVTRTPATSFQCCFLKLFPAGAGFQSFNLIALATNFPYQIFPTNVKTPSAFGGAVFFLNVFSINRMLLRHLQRSLNWRKFVRNLNVFGGAKKKEVPQGWKWKMEKWWDNHEKNCDVAPGDQNKKVFSQQSPPNKLLYILALIVHAHLVFCSLCYFWSNKVAPSSVKCCSLSTLHAAAATTTTNNNNSSSNNNNNKIKTQTNKIQKVTQYITQRK